MASIQLETICCQFEWSNRSLDHHRQYDGYDMKTHYLIYNILCMVSASVSLVGSFYQIFPCLPLPIHRSTREAESVQRQTSIINWLAVADLLACLGILVRSAVWLAGFSPHHNSSGTVDSNHIFCAAISGWIQFCYVCTYFWTMCYAIDVYRAVYEKPPCTPLYHMVGWVLPGALCLIGLLPFYTPSLTNCGTALWYRLPHYFVKYIPILMVMIGNPIIYYLTQREVQATLRSRGLYTNQERQILKNIQTKFLLVMIVFYVVWGANIIDGILIIFQRWHISWFMLGLWHFMALMNPLQALLNSIVYRGWGGCGCHCCRQADHQVRADIQSARHNPGFDDSSEVSPLISFKRSGHISSRSLPRTSQS